MTRPTSRPLRLLAVLFFAITGAPPGAMAQEPLRPIVTHVSPGDEVFLLHASLSPDGRWVVYSRLMSESSSSLWIMPAAGGESTRITSDGHWDDGPVWSGDGSRIFFSSNRPARGGDGFFGMVVTVDPTTGRTTSSPRQVTAGEIAPPASHVIQPSPDGRWVAYMSQDGADYLVNVIPAAGGNPRSVTKVDGPVSGLAWTGDGDLLFRTRPQLGDLWIVHRLSADGGTPVEIFRTDRRFGVLAPTGDLFAVNIFGIPTSRENTIEVVRADGQVVARHPGVRGMWPVAFAADGRSLFGISRREGARVRVVPVTGGRPVDVSAGEEYDLPAAWTADASQVLVYGISGDRQAIVTAGRDGRPSATPPLYLPDERDARWYGVDEDFALFHARVSADRRRLVALHRRDGTRHLLSDDVRLGSITVGAGGSYGYSGGDFLFMERDGDQVKLRAGRAATPFRLLRSFDVQLDGRTTFAVHGDRVAWYQQDGEQAHLFLSAGPGTEPARLLSTPVATQCCRVELVFSHDGRYLSTTDLGDSGSGGRIVLLDLAADGRSIRGRRVLETGARYWFDAQWLPDNSGVVVMAGYEGVRTHVLLVPLHQGEAPVVITRADPAPKWSFLLSPDGRYVAYPGEVQRGSSFWIMDLSSLTVSARTTR